MQSVLALLTNTYIHTYIQTSKTYLGEGYAKNVENVFKDRVISIFPEKMMIKTVM